MAIIDYNDPATLKRWAKAAAVRAVKTFAQTLVGSIPAGFVITPAMVEHLDWSLAMCVLVWLLNAALAGVCSLLTSVAGLPEVEVPSAQ